MSTPDEVPPTEVSDVKAPPAEVCSSPDASPEIPSEKTKGEIPAEIPESIDLPLEKLSVEDCTSSIDQPPAEEPVYADAEATPEIVKEPSTQETCAPEVTEPVVVDGPAKVPEAEAIPEPTTCE